MVEFLEELDELYKEFARDANKVSNKSAQSRARQVSLDVRKKLKEYRVLSLAADKA
mgnify:CR=1 FL=1